METILQIYWTVAQEAFNNENYIRLETFAKRIPKRTKIWSHDCGSPFTRDIVYLVNRVAAAVLMR